MATVVGGARSTEPRTIPPTSTTNSETTPATASQPARPRRVGAAMTARRRAPAGTGVVVIGGGRYGAGEGRTRSGLIATASARIPSARRGPGRVTMTSSMGRTAPFLTAVSVSQPGRAATCSGVTP